LNKAREERKKWREAEELEIKEAEEKAEA